MLWIVQGVVKRPCAVQVVPLNSRQCMPKTKKVAKIILYISNKILSSWKKPARMKKSGIAFVLFKLCEAATRFVQRQVPLLYCLVDIPMHWRRPHAWQRMILHVQLPQSAIETCHQRHIEFPTGTGYLGEACALPLLEIKCNGTNLARHLASRSCHITTEQCSKTLKEASVYLDRGTRARLMNACSGSYCRLGNVDAVCICWTLTGSCSAGQ